jgi:hypothetical protein
MPRSRRLPRRRAPRRRLDAQPEAAQQACFSIQDQAAPAREQALQGLRARLEACQDHWASALGRPWPKIIAGWSLAEPQGVWSDGHAAYLGFVVRAGTDATAGLPTRAVVRASVYLAPEKLQEQRIEVWSAGRKLARYVLGDQNSEFTVPLKNLAIRDGMPLILGFYFPDAKVPQEIELNHRDGRTLGIYLRTVQALP